MDCEAALPSPDGAGGNGRELVAQMNVQLDPKTLALLGQNVPSNAGSPGPVLRLTAPEGGSHGGTVQVPSAALLTGGEYVRIGLDLMITGPDGQQVLIEDYFLTDSPPDLTSPDGAQIAGDLAERLAGSMAPGQLAQAGAGGIAKQAIGHVETANGSVTVIHADGTKGILHKGDAIYQGDVLQTAKGAAVGLLFVDNTAMSLGGDGRMVLDSMVFDPSTGTGKSAFSLMQGTFSFVSGQIAKAAPDAMMVRTPVATIGIRGTVGSAGYTPENGLTAGLFSEGANGQTISGELIISNQGGTITINQPNLVTQVMTFFTQPPPPVPVNSVQVQIYFGQSLIVLTAPANNPDALRAVLNLQQDAKGQGVEPGLMASEPDKKATGAQEIEVKQVASKEQIAKDMLVQATVINALIESGQGIDAAQGTGKGARTSIDKDNRPLDEIAKDLKSDFGDVGEGGQGQGQGETTVRVVWDNKGEDNQNKAIQNLIDDIREKAEQNREFNEAIQDIIDSIREQFENAANNNDDDDNNIIDAADDTTVFADTLTASSATTTLIGGTGNTNFIFDYSTFSSEGWSTYALDTGNTNEDRLTFTNLQNVILTVKKDTTFPNARVVGTLYEGLSSHITIGTIDSLSGWTSSGDVTISNAIDDLQASSGGLSEGKILTNAMASIPGTTDIGYIVAGTSSGETIDLSASGNFANPMGSIIFGLGGIDTISGTAEKDIIYGGADGDQITGGQGTDLLYGEDGNDTLIGGMGADALYGGNGTDLAKYADTVYAIYANIGIGTVVQTVLGTDVIDSIEWIWGSTGNDTLVGGSGNDTLWGDAGNDTISGMNGNDDLNGEGGTGDWLSYADETGGSGAQINIDDNIAVDTWGNSDTISNFENIIGSSYNDQLAGNSSANTFIGGQGNDQITGAGGLDCLDHSGNTAAIFANFDSAAHSSIDPTTVSSTASGTDTFSGIYHIIGSNYADTFYGSSSTNSITGGKGDDIIDLVTSTDTQSDMIFISGGAAALAAGLARLATLGTDTIVNFETGYDKIYLDQDDTGLANTISLVDSTNYKEATRGIDSTSWDYLAGTATATATSTKGLILVGASSGTAGVAVYYTEDVTAVTSSNSYQIATLGGINTGQVAAGDFDTTA